MTSVLSNTATVPVIELPESVRIPLHSLQADLGYLIGRVAADGSCGSMVIKSMKDRLDQVEKALLTDDHEDRMEKISALISRLQSTLDQFGDTCVYIRRGGLSWGAVALNRRADDKKHGVFDLQAQHDRDMLQRLEQIERLKASRNAAETRLNETVAALKEFMGHWEKIPMWNPKEVNESVERARAALFR